MSLGTHANMGRQQNRASRSQASLCFHFSCSTGTWALSPAVTRNSLAAPVKSSPLLCCMQDSYCTSPPRAAPKRSTAGAHHCAGESGEDTPQQRGLLLSHGTPAPAAAPKGSRGASPALSTPKLTRPQAEWPGRGTGPVAGDKPRAVQAVRAPRLSSSTSSALTEFLPTRVVAACVLSSPGESTSP